MKRNLFIVVLFVLLMLAGITMGAGASRMLPALPVVSAGNLASAAALSINPLTPLTPTGTGFTYQGSLKSGGNPTTGSYDFQLSLYDADSGGTLVTNPITLTNQTVTAGLFTLSLDFGSSAFDGNARYLEIAVRQSGGGSYTTLSPRQAITPAPYALFALKTKGYKGVVVVAKSGGDFTSVQAALTSITDNSASNRYLIRVGPGTYTETVTMKQYSDIEGSGEDNTRITFSGSNGPTTGTVVGADNAELRSLTVENTGGNTHAIAIYNNFTSPSLLHVTAHASGGSAANYAVFLQESSSNIQNVTATASGLTGSEAVGAYIRSFGNGSSLKIMNSVISAGGATNNYGVFSDSGGTATIDNSKITGSTSALYNFSGTTGVGASQLAGGPVILGGTLTCSASYDGNNKRLGADCTHNTKVAIVGLTDGDYISIQAALNDTATWCGTPSATNRCLVHIQPGTYTERVTMVPYVDIEGSGEKATKITFTGSPVNNTGTVVGASDAELRSLTVENTGGSSYAIGIYDNGVSALNLQHLTVTATGASTTGYSVYNVSSQSRNFNMTDVTVETDGGAQYNLGVYNGASSPNMTNVTANVSGASIASYGVFNESNSAPYIVDLTAIAETAGVIAYGVYDDNSSPEIVGSVITSVGAPTSYGVYHLNGGTVMIDSSKIAGSTATIYNINAATTTYVGASNLWGGTVFLNGGTLRCAGVYDENYTFFPSTCP